MKDVEVLVNELDEKTDAAMAAAQTFCDALAAFEEIEPGDRTTEEDEKNYRGFASAIDTRRLYCLKRILIEYGNLLYL